VEDAMTVKPKYLVYHSAVLDTSVAKAWTELRDMLVVLDIVFGQDVENGHWVGGGSVAKVPSTFEFTLLPGHELIREEIAGRSEADHSVTYRTIGQALSLVDYVATYRLKPITNEGKKRCFVEWSREFSIVDGADPNFLDFILALLPGEVAKLKAHFAGAPIAASV
jgi:hypothetical protein